MERMVSYHLSRDKRVWDWLDAVGQLFDFETRDTYKIDIAIAVGDVATMTIYRYKRNEDGNLYLLTAEDGTRDVARMEPFMVPIFSLPVLPQPPDAPVSK